MGRARLTEYSLVGAGAERAVAAGLSGASWFRSAIPRKRMKELMARSDGPAICDTVLWLGLILGFGALGVASWGSWWAVPAFAVYGMLYGGSSDSRWH